jgi:hypothetical protein
MRRVGEEGGRACSQTFARIETSSGEMGLR